MLPVERLLAAECCWLSSVLSCMAPTPCAVAPRHHLMSPTRDQRTCAIATLRCAITSGGGGSARPFSADAPPSSSSPTRRRGSVAGPAGRLEELMQAWLLVFDAYAEALGRGSAVAAVSGRPSSGIHPLSPSDRLRDLVRVFGASDLLLRDSGGGAAGSVGLPDAFSQRFIAFYRWEGDTGRLCRRRTHSLVKCIFHWHPTRLRPAQFQPHSQPQPPPSGAAATR